ncbi:hypothetical protein GCK32_016078, partial [Trichostrongylus colubriformis]
MKAFATAHSSGALPDDVRSSMVEMMNQDSRDYVKKFEQLANTITASRTRARPERLFSLESIQLVTMMGGSEFKVPMLPNKMALVSTGGENKSEPQRCSNLKAPIMLLTGHEEEIFAARFSTDGTCLATAGFDQKIFLWNVYGDCENFSVIRGHTGAIMDVHFNTDSSLLVSAATDKTVRV